MLLLRLNKGESSQSQGVEKLARAFGGWSAVFLNSLGIKKLPEGSFLKIKRINNIGELMSAAILKSFCLLDHLLLQFPCGFDFIDHFGGSAGLFNGWLNEIAHQGFQVAEAKHFDDASAKVRMKKPCFQRRKKSNSRFRVLPDW
jgi:hypothetical protein